MIISEIRLVSGFDFLASGNRLENPIKVRREKRKQIKGTNDLGEIWFDQPVQ